MKSIPQDVSLSTRRRNPHLYGSGNGMESVTETVCDAYGKPVAEITYKKRVRQNSKPLLNKTEFEFKRLLSFEVPPSCIRDQSITLRLCNGVRYTPDLFAFHDGQMQAWEVKGPQQIQDDASVKIKMAAHEYPEIKFQLVWKDRCGWQRQNILS